MARSDRLPPQLVGRLSVDHDGAMCDIPPWSVVGHVHYLAAMSTLLIVALRRLLSALLVAAAAFLCLGLGAISTVEGYIWFDPYIDTWFAQGYRPELGMDIRVGMTRKQVEAIIGEPLGTTLPNRFQPGLFGAYYTNDGGHDRRLGIQHRDRRHRDFAWHYFTVMYDSMDVVHDIYSGWGYD
jgi:hypothetical protein